MKKKIIRKEQVGDIDFDGHVEFINNCTVSGNLTARSVEARESLYVIGDIWGGQNIKVGENLWSLGRIWSFGFVRSSGNIEVQGAIDCGDIVADGSIKSSRYICVLGNINVGRYVSAVEEIIAGESINAGWYIFSFDYIVKSAFISTKRLPFGRKFWAAMPPFKKWKREILSAACWNDLRSLPTKEEAIRICTWEGWHWLLRAHLEMFFGLKERISPPIGSGIKTLPVEPAINK